MCAPRKRNSRTSLLMSQEMEDWRQWGTSQHGWIRIEPGILYRRVEELCSSQSSLQSSSRNQWTDKGVKLQVKVSMKIRMTTDCRHKEHVRYLKNITLQPASMNLRWCTVVEESLSFDHAHRSTAATFFFVMCIVIGGGYWIALAVLMLRGRR